MVQAALFRRADSSVGSQAALLKASKRRQAANAWAGKPIAIIIAIWKPISKQWHFIWDSALQWHYIV